MVDAGREGHPDHAERLKAIVPAIEKARAKGVLVIALDTPTEPQSAVDALFATDNLKAGELIGEYAKAGQEWAQAARSRCSTWRRASASASCATTVPEGLRVTEGDPRSSAPQDTSGDQARARRRWRTAAEGHGHQRRLHDQRARRASAARTPR